MQIHEIIIKSLFSTLSDVEQQQMDEWLEKDDHAAIYRRIVEDKERVNDPVEFMADIDVEEALEQVYQKRRARWLRYLRYAAAVLILIVAGGAYWYSQYTKVTPPEITEAVQLAMQQSKESGMHDAKIEPIQREEITTDPFGWNQKEKEITESSYKEPQGSSVLNHSVSQDNSSTLTKEQLLAARRITTKHDKEFWMTLEDGTLVHLNYNSRLIYPEKFGRGDRNVILDGEAYFMVAKDKSRPFIVHTLQGDVRVYGTEFNVNTRKENNGVSVVLVKGSVGFTAVSGKETMMLPGQELTVNNSYPTAVTVNEVDLAPYIAWNEGKFTFQDWPLERVMEVMSRWYGYHVRFGNDQLKQIGISGKLGRYNEAETTMDAIATITGLDITIKGNEIIINP